MARARLSINRADVAGILERARKLAVEPAAGNIFEDEVARSVILADLENLDDVRMLKAGGRLGLGVKPSGRVGVRVGIGANHLEATTRFKLTCHAL